jgi:hypothetical protein
MRNRSKALHLATVGCVLSLSRAKRRLRLPLFFRMQPQMLDRAKVVLDISPARDRSFRDFVLMRKRPVPPCPLKQSPAREYHLYR